MERLKIGEQTFYWLNGGVTHLDGGAMFGVVPKPLWSKKYPANERNQIELRTDPIFFQLNGKNILIESGIGNGKFTEKQRRNYGVNEEADIEESLKTLGLSRNDIDIVCMTHLHFDHACGLTIPTDDGFESAFPNAIIYTSQIEWDEMRNPNMRSRNTYWSENWEAIQHQVQTFQHEIMIENAFQMVHTGGHSNGHAIITGECNGEKWVHMADLLPTHAHLNPLWVMAYDDYPMNSIFQKKKWLDEMMQSEAWFLFYHDAFYRALKWDKDGNICAEVKR
ncbi:YtnP family quorum-quenching lactonase [Heyndrickxia ginsengihumi]|uniref:MBL fold metallo-hydrolase n=1 Tax=Heyndrickxia ginsengihumi TaxID=363870 RepID=A0A6M0P8F5_9BACI|nr:MBL fold metallo-hydrolase [Heyndrickxia ginsengihumi]MBE6185037.1 MBL fold metallo-hydrolase [Bacillus sp. (in: firmicutes)]NEY20986.1 MBL fold metallo-hydrolase [Heyndrickxia ginsengihumi]